MRAYIASIRAKKGRWIVTRVVKPDIDIVAWWKHEMLLLSSEQLRETGQIEGPVWKDGEQQTGPYPQMTLWLTGFLR